jgi:hypothetical protein
LFQLSYRLRERTSLNGREYKARAPAFARRNHRHAHPYTHTHTHTHRERERERERERFKKLYTKNYVLHFNNKNIQTMGGCGGINL